MKKPLLYLALLLFSTVAYAQDKAVHYKELQKHLPESLAGFTAEGDPDGNMFEMNDMSYSSAMREYSKGDSYLTVTIMDYKGAASMYQGSTMAWNNSMSYEDEEQKAHSVSINGMNGWFSYDKSNKETTLLLGINGRYLVTINITENEDEDLAENIAKTLNLNGLPQ
ncbi:hypothetical protein GCM10009122_21170 [Fulvivirga kasyanovii]|uniref:DUF4367 domain-containing protein n=1 Tax=Fulvivirga kasyanovii TaxID=396812 RepID=A0ABW9RUL2_9BACT|nr:hypothetical protein [Fulvivirga kasyanovii]MTI27909.1 hypothetical protein [Fulvivirga kasyanovii]